MTLLTICQDVQRRLKLEVSSIFVSALDTTSQHLYALANEEGEALSKRASWQALVSEYTFTSVAEEAQPDGLPSDWNGRFINETFWNRSEQRKLQGPLSSQEWQAQKATTASAIFDSFRVRGDTLLILPTASAGHTYAYEYVSDHWARSAGGAPKPGFSADDDYSIFDEEILKLGVRWRWERDNELDYAEDFRLYEEAVEDAIARDGSKRTLDMGYRRWDGPYVPGVPEGSWPL